MIISTVAQIKQECRGYDCSNQFIDFILGDSNDWGRDDEIVWGANCKAIEVEDHDGPQRTEWYTLRIVDCICTDGVQKIGIFRDGASSIVDPLHSSDTLKDWEDGFRRNGSVYPWAEGEWDGEDFVYASEESDDEIEERTPGVWNGREGFWVDTKNGKQFEYAS